MRRVSLALIASSTIIAAVVHCGSNSSNTAPAPLADASPELATAQDAAKHEDATTDDTKSDSAPPIARRGLSFLAVSDLHLGFPDDEDDGDDGDDDDDDATGGPTVLEVNRAAAAVMNALATPAHEKELAAFSISNDFRGVIAAGDLTNAALPFEWKQFLSVYGFDGGDGALHLPMFETSGNHDYVFGKSDAGLKSPSEVFPLARIGERNATRGNVVAKADSGAYAWKWDDVLFVNLGVKISNDDHGPTSVVVKNGEFRFTDPFHSLTFLRDTLANAAINPPGTRVFLTMHYAIHGAESRYSAAERQAFYDVIKNHRIAAILHGHNHRSDLWSWCGIPVFELGTPREAIRAGFDATVLAVDVGATQLTARTVRWNATNVATPAFDYDTAKCNLRNQSSHCWTYQAAYTTVKAGCDVSAPLVNLRK